LHDFNDFLLIPFFSRGGVEAPLATSMQPVVGREADPPQWSGTTASGLDPSSYKIVSYPL
jgi:hypothetical protein